MSLDTWKAEFYPVPAEKVPEDEALSHSHRKWVGLRKENLSKHALRSKDGEVLQTNGRFTGFCIDDSTCALCHHFNNSSRGDRAENCQNCPLFLTRGEPCCEFEKGDESKPSPYCDMMALNDPEPMIALIEKAMETEPCPPNK